MADLRGLLEAMTQPDDRILAGLALLFAAAFAWGAWLELRQMRDAGSAARTAGRTTRPR
jgi:hypothetical protein